MKKVIALTLALILCLSLCACGGDKTNGTSREAKLSKEDILNGAFSIDLNNVGSAFDNNKANAQDTYYNKYYTIVGTVQQIESNKVIIKPITAVFGNKFSTASQCHVNLPTDEIKTLSTSSVIKVCGKLTEFEKGYDYYNLTLEDAFFVDNVIEITAKITDINNYAGGKKSIVLSETIQNGSSIGSNFYEIVVAESGAENSEEAEFMGTTYYAGDKVTFSGTLSNNPNMGSNYYDVSNLSTISKH